MRAQNASIMILSLMMSTPAFGQDKISAGVTKSIWDAIQSSVTSHLDSSYQIMDVVNVDSAVGNRSVADGAVTNRNGTLSGCYVFTARQRGNAALSLHGTVGVYRSGNIVWQSNPATMNATFANMPSISAIRDLDNDGRGDIVTSWYGGAMGSIEWLWIFGWDGQTGNLINAVDDHYESVLISLSSGFEYVDVNGDSICEIAGQWYANPLDEQAQKVIYSWNGLQYGKWNPPQPLPSGFYPRDRVGAVVKTVVKGVGSRFSYHYALESLPSSRQMINAFVLVTPPDSIMNGASPEDWDFGGVPTKALGWLAPVGFDVSIEPGSSKSSFYFESSRLPGIVQSLVRGDNGNWSSILGDSVEYTIDQWYDEARGNSFKVLTLGPADVPSPFVPLDFLDTLTNYTTESRSLGWIKDQPTSDKYVGYFSSAKTSLQQNNIGSVRTILQQVLQDVNVDSTRNLTSEAYALIRFNTEYLLGQLPNVPPPSPGLNVKLINSTGTKLTGGSLQYYDGSWKNATNNNDGTFRVTTSLKTLSLRMLYEFATQTKSNVIVVYDTVAFQTVNAQVKLQNNQGTPIDTGTVQYYASAWRNFGTTATGVASKELLPGNYSFRMTYAYTSNDKQQDIGTNRVVVFLTVNTTVQLQNSQGSPMDQGAVQYYSGAWRLFGTTTNGAVAKELLPKNYSFRMSYAFASNDKQQNIGTNPTVVFQTVNATVQLKNSQGNPTDQGTVQYYSGAWRSFGVTTNGAVSKELLPHNYSFRMTHEFVSNDKAHDISTNSAVSFSTILCTIRVKNSQNQPVDGAQARYYSGAWRTIGPTSNGDITKELLPANLTFRITVGTVSQNKAQNTATNALVEFVVQ